MIAAPQENQALLLMVICTPTTFLAPPAIVNTKQSDHCRVI